MGPTSSEPAVVTSRANARVKQLRAAFAGKTRLGGGLIAIEGDKLLGEALHTGMVLKTIFLSERRELPRIVPRGVEVLWLTNDVFESVVETRSPQGIAALLVPPLHTVESMMVGTPLILVAVGLQDPGNLGTLIRSAEAFGATGVLTTMETVSAWNQKSLRASAGSVFRLPVVHVAPEELLTLKSGGVRLMAAVAEARTDSADVRDVVMAQEAPFTGAAAIMIGNEGAGLSEEVLALADDLITIPCPGRVESLNAAVAGSLLLYEASRQRARKAAC